jgi:Dyp-type peroxidase family
MLDEPLLDLDDIQGHVLVGFGRAFELLLGLKLIDGRLDQAKVALSNIVSHKITRAGTAARAKEVRRQLRLVGEAMPVANLVGCALALSATGLDKLAGVGQARQFSDSLFVEGQWADARALGDEVDAITGTPVGWQFGDSEQTTPDVLFIVAGPEFADVEQGADAILATFGDSVVVIYRECGRRIARQAEHFGFVDGVSQPGVRGRSDEGTFLTPRYYPENDPASLGWARPGQRLTWPGQFVFGYPGLDPDAVYEPGEITGGNNPLLRNGSLLVVRRLSQDVGRFWRAMADLADQLTLATGRPWTPEHAGAMCVGRWLDGTPLTQSPSEPDSAISANLMRLNGFNYVSPVPAAMLNIDDATLRDFPGARADGNGLACPYFSHIRKVNPRDHAHDFGGAGSTLHSQMLRRGVPFGPDWTGVEDRADRGLLFMSYQTSIQQGFHRLMTEWVKDALRPLAGGIDPLLGQVPRELSLIVDGRAITVSLPDRFVRATGGGYFFAPGLRALQSLLH